MTRLLEGNVGTQMARVAPQPMGWSASVASMRSLGVARSRAGNATPSTAAPLVVAPVAYHARSSRRGRRANRKPRPSPDDRVESADGARPPGLPRGYAWACSGTEPGGAGPVGHEQGGADASLEGGPALGVLAVPVGATPVQVVTVDPGDAVVRWSQGSAIALTSSRVCGRTWTWTGRCPRTARAFFGDWVPRRAGASRCG